MPNEFETLNENEFSEESAPATSAPSSSGNTEFTYDDLVSGGASYINNPDVGESIEFVVAKIENNPVTERMHEGKRIVIGCERQDKTIIRRDLITDDGKVYTISNWEIFYKIFGKDSEFVELAKKRKAYQGIKVKITKNYNGQLPSLGPDVVAKILDMTRDEAKVHIAEIKKAMDEKRLYTVEVSAE